MAPSPRIRSSVSRPGARRGRSRRAPGGGALRRRRARRHRLTSRSAAPSTSPSPSTMSRVRTLRLVNSSWPGPAVPGVAEAAHRQAELGDQPVAEGRGVHAGDPHRPVRPADVDPAAVGDLDDPAAVGGDPGAVAVGGDGDGQHRVRRGDQRAGEERVRVARHEQQRLDVGPDHRAAGGEGVGGRAGGGGAQDAVAAEAGQRPAVDGDDDVEHPGALGLLDRHLVERPGAADDRAVGVEDVDLDGQPLLDRVLAPLDGAAASPRPPRARSRRGSRPGRG